LGILLVTACKMGPDYARPDQPSREGWRLAPTTSESLANLPWWDLLKDEELQKLIRLALEENLDLRIATANIEEYQAQLIIAKFDLAPSATYGANGFFFRNTNNALSLGDAAIIPGPTPQSGGLSFSNEKAHVGLKWEVDLWGRIRRSIEATRAQLLSKEENQRAVILGLVSNVAESYFDLRMLDLQVEITRRTLKSWEETVRLSDLRYKQGYIPKLDLDRFEAERAGTAAHLADLERQVIQKENQISVLLGHRPMTITRGLVLTDQPLPPQVPPGLPSDLLERRPDVLQAEQGLAAATATIGVAQAQRFPQFALTGSVGGASVQLSSMSLGPFATFSASGNLTGPLLSATALGYQVDATEAQARAAEAQYRKAVLTAFKEVEDALIAVQKSGEQRLAQEQQVAALQSAFRLADLRYQGGRASYLDVLTAQRSLFDAEISLARTRNTQLTSVVQLYKALGGGWQNGPDPKKGIQQDPEKARAVTVTQEPS
jgi:multidrug efflux system outer membrane protein